MHARTLPLLAAALLALPACASSPSDVRNEPEAAPPPAAPAPAAAPAPGAQQSMRWTATLTPVGGSGVTGTAMFAPDGRNQRTDAAITLRGAQPNTAVPWHIHQGTCAGGGGIFGSHTAYPELPIGSDGTGTLTLTLPFDVPMGRSYFVSVHRSHHEMSTILACGDLSMQH